MNKKSKLRKYSSQLEDGIDVSPKEVKRIYKDLQQKYQEIEEEILAAIERNDYTFMSDLVIERNKISLAIKTVEAIVYDIDRHRFFLFTDGVKLQSHLHKSLAALNSTSQKIASSLVNGTAKSLKYSSQFNEKLNHSLNNISDRLFRLSKQLLKQSKGREANDARKTKH
ncbi:hypothetical protein [Lysinibacillus sp. JNUCC-52]|uniref:hypothetical protein n=1 Tax=Lysinibacillus sp. JNUCC-52 TaxID=2792480 RepID=UPI0019359892|nr:hypothetical protein JNUCC52_17770 [Lysinibacillus sp. JNUCC-52]